MKALSDPTCPIGKIPVRGEKEGETQGPRFPPLKKEKFAAIIGSRYFIVDINRPSVAKTSRVPRIAPSLSSGSKRSFGSVLARTIPSESKRRSIVASSNRSTVLVLTEALLPKSLVRRERTA